MMIFRWEAKCQCGAIVQRASSTEKPKANPLAPLRCPCCNRTGNVITWRIEDAE